MPGGLVSCYSLSAEKYATGTVIRCAGTRDVGMTQEPPAESGRTRMPSTALGLICILLPVAAVDGLRERREWRQRRASEVVVYRGWWLIDDDTPLFGRQFLRVEVDEIAANLKATVSLDNFPGYCRFQMIRSDGRLAATGVCRVRGYDGQYGVPSPSFAYMRDATFYNEHGDVCSEVDPAGTGIALYVDDSGATVLKVETTHGGEQEVTWYDEGEIVSRDRFRLENALPQAGH